MKKLKKVLAMLIMFVILAGSVFPNSVNVNAATYSNIMLSGVPYFPQKISNDCGISAISMIEAYALGYDSSCFDAIYESVYRANGNTLSIGTAVNNGQYTDISKDLESVYNQLKAGNPVLIYRGTSSYHWSVIVGYNGSTTTLEKSGFIVYNTALGTNVGEPYTSNLSDWLSGNSWLHAKVRTSGAISGITTSVSSLTLQNVRYPSNLKTGSGMGSGGLLISNAGITMVSAGVKNSSGTVKFSANATPNSKYFGLMNFDSSMKFGSLSAGTYTYYVTATDSTGATLYWEKQFTVSSSSTILKSDTVSAGGSYDNSPIVDTSFFYDSGVESVTDTGARIDASFPSVQSSITAFGFYLGTSQDNMQKYTETESYTGKLSQIYYYLGTGKWTQPLSPNTTYYYKLWAVVNGITYETPINNFTTKAETGATIDTSFFYDSGVESITDTGARIDASFPSVQSGMTAMGFYLGTSQDNMQKYTESESHTGKCSQIFYYLGTGKWTDALTPGTTYYYKLWAKVNGVLYETPVSSFTTTGDNIAPVISDIQVSVDCQGYTVSCIVTDNGGVSSVKFPSWTLNNGQDDLVTPWEEGSESQGVYSFRVNYSAHNNEEWVYFTHIYAYDNTGNCTQGEIEPIDVNIASLHSYSDWNITPATCTTAGSQSRTCSTCGHTETQAIEAIGHTIDSNGVCINCDEVLEAKITSANLSVTSQDRNSVSMKMDITLSAATDVEYRWNAYNKTSGNSYTINDWTNNLSSVNWIPPEFGEYNITVDARVINNTSSIATKSMIVDYNPHIKGKCQMPYYGEGGGYLIGVESYENPNQSYYYEMLILDCTLLAEGKPAWVYTTGMYKVGEGNAGWCIWQPQYGYYWTLFRVYDANGVMIDQACYGFANVY